MPRRKIMLVLLAIVGCVALAVMLWPEEPEPVYKGKKLSEWLAFVAKTASPDETRLAIEYIGTNGIPFYLEWMRYEPSFVKRAESILAHYVGRWLHLKWSPGDAKVVRAFGAYQALTTLGEKAEPAIPQYIACATNAAARAPRPLFLNQPIYGILGLVHVGPPAIPAFLSLMTNTDPQVRILAIQQTPQFYGSTSVVARLRICLQDPDYQVRVVATNVVKFYDYDLGGPMDRP
jgi:hypothetical protein